MKVSTSKAPSILKDLIAEKSRRIEIAWPEESAERTEAVVATPAPQTTPEPSPAPMATVEPVVSVEPVTATIPTPILESPVIEIPAATQVPEPTQAVEAPVVQEVAAVVSEAPLPQAVAEPVAEVPAAPIENPVEPETEIVPAPRRPKTPKVQDLLGSDAWIRSLTRCLIDSEKTTRGTSDGSAPIKELWNRLREDSQREKRLAKMETLSQQCAQGRFKIAPQEVSDLKMRFLHAIRRIQEPYRSTLIYHYCEGLSVGEMVDRLGISSWIIRERLAKSLEQLDHILAEELGKEKTKRYVLLAQLGEN